MLRILRTLPFLRQPFPRSLPSHQLIRSTPRRSLVDQHGLVKVQHVRIKQRRRFQGLAYRFLNYVAYTSLIYVTLGLLLEEDDEEEDSGSHTDENEQHGEKDLKVSDTGDVDAAKPTKNEEDAIFIPLGFAYQLPRQFYKGTDPEWQSFVKLSHDKNLCNSLKHQLAGLVGRHVGPSPSIEQVLGKGNKPVKFWLDIDFPDRPPPEYERKGIEITEDHIAWTTRPVHPLHYKKLQQALWPTSIASSVWASYKTIASLQYAKLKKHLNLPLNSETSNTSDSNAAELDLRNVHQRMSPEKQKSAPESESEKHTESSNASKSPGQPSTGSWSSDLSKKLPSWPAVPGLDDEIASAMTAFGKTFARTWQPASPPLERGTAVFSGFVELVGPKGVAVLDVVAGYHAAEARWTTVSVSVRRLQQKKQSPKGGR
ncbi:MAG: hypothetical protein Q9201_002958 [Fulgogasparrea decipioides]